MNMNYLRIFIVLFLFVSVSCTKEGPVGPQGEKGEQGEKGDKGDTGAQGEQGETGNANVKYSDWINLEESDWGYAGGVGSTDLSFPGAYSAGYYANLTSLTQEEADQAAILVYIDKAGDGIELLSTTLSDKMSSTSGTSTYLYRAIYNRSEGFAKWLMVVSNILTAGSGTMDQNYVKGTILTKYSFRYVIIPPATGTNKSTIADNMDFYKNYETVAAKYGITD
jgi:hypothetical protein